MESNFHLKTRTQNRDLHIDLYGVFYGASAFKLINALKKKGNGHQAVFIDTNRLTRTYSFGRTVLNAHLPKTVHRNHVHFSGLKAREIMPQGCHLFKKEGDRFRVCTGDCANCDCRPEGRSEYRAGPRKRGPAESAGLPVRG